MTVTRSVVLFVLAGLCEIGGGWLMWQWLRGGRPAGWGVAGAAVLVLYGIVPTLQPASFGRTYATYGGFFIALSLLWGWAVDGTMPDGIDIAGAVVALGGVAMIMYWPR
jgi:small multidrug resistance family-3 protein